MTVNVVLPPSERGIMSQILRNHVQPIDFKCRFAAPAAVAGEFCAFGLPACEKCPKAQPTFHRMRDKEDPMNSEVWHLWITSVAGPKP